MAASTAQFHNKRSKLRRSSREMPIGKPPVEPIETAQGSPFTRAVHAILLAPARLALFLSILGISVLALVGYVQRICLPQCVVVVQPFEISPELAKRFFMSGKTASNMFIDSLNQHSAFGSQFQGADYYQYDAAGTQSIALKQSIRVPVQSSEDFEVNGIWIGNIMKVYSWIRNKQWLVGGDILTAGDRTLVRLRLNGEGVAKYWEITDSGGSDGLTLIRRATEAMLAEQNPEILGRSLLQQHQYSRAIDIFRSWELKEPRNWKPSYYLSLAYDYEGHTREALCLARWSADIAMQEKQMTDLESKKPASSNTGNPAQLAAVTEAVFEMNKLPNNPAKSVTEASERLAVLKKAEQSLDHLALNNPSNLNYSIQLARTLDREADLELDPLARLDEASKNENRAIELLDKAIKQAPDNGGLYEQRSIFLQRKVMIAGKQGVPGFLISEMKKKETDGFRRALELSPRNDSPLWGAVYGLLDRHENEGALELAHTVLLLQPESSTAEAAYTVALARAGKTDEAKLHLSLLLDKASQTELEALSNSFDIISDPEVRDQIADAAKRRSKHELKTGQPDIRLPGQQEREAWGKQGGL